MSRKRQRRPERKPAEATPPPAAPRRSLRLSALPWWAVAVLAGLAAALLFGDDLLFVQGNPQFLDHAGNALLTAADGYHYLYLADAAQRVGAPGFALPGLAFLALHLSNLLGVGLLRVACWLPPLLAVLLGPAMVLLSRSLGLSRGAALLAALAACAAPYWHARSNLGYFDTDCLIPPLVLLACWGLLRFTLGDGPRRWAGLALSAISLAWLRWWWGPSALPLAGGLVGAYALTVFAPSARWERWPKALLLAAGLALAGLFLLRHDLPLPGALGQIFEFAAAHLHLVTHQQAAPVQVGATIGELKSVGILGLGEITLAQAWILVPALAGLALLAVRQWPGMLQLLPLLGLGGLSLASVRFAIFLGPLLGLGLGALVDRGWAWTARLGARSAAARAGVVLLGLGLVAPAVQQGLTLKFPPPFTAQETFLAEALGREAGARGESGSVAWLWWDYGYLVNYYARMEPLFHGGSQDPDSCFRAAFPLALADPPLAAGWMRALARGGAGALGQLSDRLRGEPQALEFLARALPAPQDFPALAAAAGLPDPGAWMTRLFPAAPVYLYLPLPMLDRLPVLWEFSLAHMPGAPPAAPEFLARPRGQVRVDPSRGLAAVDGRELPLSLVVHVLPQGVQVRSLGRAGHILVDVAGLPRLYLLQQDYGRSLLFRLLFTAPRDTPGFACLAYDSRVGGVWRVE